MENASKALLIAGGVLLAIMILSLGVYLFQSAGSLSQSYDEKLSQDSINAFNNKFLTYAKDINAQNMVSLLNLVKENNSKNNSIPEKQIKLFINNVELDMGVATEKWKINIMQLEESTEEPSYKFLKVQYNNSGYINRLEFKTLKAGYIYVPAVCNHNWGMYNNIGAEGHIKICTKCSMEEVVIHTYGNYSNQGNGKHLRNCSYCGYQDTKPHNWGAFIKLSDTDHRSKCGQCNATKDEEHQWGNYSNLGNSSGHKRSCNICGEIQTAHHTWSAWEITKVANCTQDGEQKASCTTCNASKTESIEGLEHDFSIAATCTTAEKCSRCGKTNGTKLGHSKGPEATCTTPQTCTRCDFVIADKLNHTKGPEATCTTPQTCTRCNFVIADKLNHAKGAEPTCTTAQICTRCNIVIADKLNHAKGSEATCTKPQICTRCNKILKDATGHNDSCYSTACKGTFTKKSITSQIYKTCSHTHTASGRLISGTALSNSAGYSSPGGCYTTASNDTCPGKFRITSILDQKTSTSSLRSSCCSAKINIATKFIQTCDVCGATKDLYLPDSLTYCSNCGLYMVSWGVAGDTHVTNISSTSCTNTITKYVRSCGKNSGTVQFRRNVETYSCTTCGATCSRYLAALATCSICLERHSVPESGSTSTTHKPVEKYLICTN